MDAHFVGEVDVRWLVENGEDRKMQLLSDFAFVDSNNVRWEAKKNDVIDGASIPEVIWSQIVGTPFIGDYRRASVVHDVACDKQMHTSKDAHRMFYEAMLADGTPQPRALLFYTAVRLFGPQWEKHAGLTSIKFKSTLLSSTSGTVLDFNRLEQALDEVLGADNKL